MYDKSYRMVQKTKIFNDFGPLGNRLISGYELII